MVRFLSIILSAIALTATSASAAPSAAKVFNGTYSGIFETVFSSCGEPGAFTSTIQLRVLKGGKKIRARFPSGLSSVGRIVSKRSAKIPFKQYVNGLELNSVVTVTRITAIGATFVIQDRVSPIGNTKALICSEQHVASFLQRL